MKWFNFSSTNTGKYNSNEDWIKALSPPPVADALEELRSFLLKGLKATLYRNVKRDLEDFVQDIAQDSILKILDKLETFRGESKFTTWALKISIRDAYTELRRKRYKDISLNYSESNPEIDGVIAILSDDIANPEQVTHESIIAEKVMKIIEEELTTKQREVMELLIIEQMPMTIVADKLDTNRNAIYKLMFDSRLKIKNKLLEQGIDSDTLFDN